MRERNWFRADSLHERSGDILVSFDSKWLDRLRGGAVERIVRRRYPKSFSPRRMYLYVAAPHSELIGFVYVNALHTIVLNEGIRLLTKTGLTRDELESYFTGYENLGCYAVSPTTLLKPALSLEALRAGSGFSPPQNFVALSRRASDWLAQQPTESSAPGCRPKTTSKVTGRQR
jgi:predicted transcriptional regulator